MKLDLNNIAVSPPREWLAVHKNGRDTMEVDVLDRQTEEVSGHANMQGEFATTSSYTTWKFSECHLCQSVGYTDSQGGKVFDGHMVRLNKEVFYIAMVHYEWRLVNKDGQIPLSACHPSLVTTIGHIHQPDQWPEEVRRLLE
jgi:hypothetical protein